MTNIYKRREIGFTTGMMFGSLMTLYPLGYFRGELETGSYLTYGVA